MGRFNHPINFKVNGSEHYEDNDYVTPPEDDLVVKQEPRDFGYECKGQLHKVDDVICFGASHKTAIAGKEDSFSLAETFCLTDCDEGWRCYQPMEA
jgi:hypothetical protein